jgi:hypothetical protein
MSDPPAGNPYAAPASPPEPSPTSLPTAPATGPYGPFRDTQTAARTVITLLWIGFAAEFDSPAADTYLEGVSHEWLTQALQSGAMVQVPIYLITIVFFGIWINLSCKNAWLFQAGDRQGFPSLRRLSSHTMTVTPGWAVGWYFVPVANLWKPYAAMGEIRNASGAGTLGAVLPLWWGLWIGSNLLGHISLRLPTDTIPHYVFSSIFDLITAPVSLGSNVLAVLLVAGITRIQYAGMPHPVSEPGQP